MPTATMEYSRLATALQKTAALVDRHLDRWLPKASVPPERLHEAIRYALFGGGKRLRPVLALWTCQALGGRPAEALPAACALELIHTYSLVHDDLPAMDDDDFRRGRPSCHKAFDEATAILVGDGLQATAFELLATRTRDASIVPALVSELGQAAGTQGMVGGQQLDLDADTHSSAEQLHSIHLLKTAALFTAAARLGAIAAHASRTALEQMTPYGKNLGLAFQIVDDLLDVSATVDELGKTPGKDARQKKATYPALFGTEESQRKAETCVAEAIRALDSLGPRRRRLVELAEFILSRTH